MARINMDRLICCFILMTTLALVSTKDQCPKLKPAVGLKINELFGTWYAIRGIEHTTENDSNNTRHTKVCPMVTISSKERFIEFQWDTKDKAPKKMELKQNKNNPGLLIQVSKKGKSKSTLQITILEQTKNVIIITMCKSGKYASVVLSRSPEFVEDEAKLITDILSSQGLSVSNFYDRCLKN